MSAKIRRQQRHRKCRMQRKQAERRRQCAARRQRIRRRLERRGGGVRPLFAARNIHYETADRQRGISCGGIGTMHLLARRLGLIEAIDDRLHLLKIHLPYHESDHVRGWLSWLHRQRSVEIQVAAHDRLTNLVELFREWSIIRFDDQCAAEFRRLQRMRIRIGTMDLKIAASRWSTMLCFSPPT